MISFIIIGKNSLHLHNDIDHRFLSDTFQVDLLLLLLHVHHVLLLLRVHKSIRVHVHIHIHIDVRLLLNLRLWLVILEIPELNISMSKHTIILVFTISSIKVYALRCFEIALRLGHLELMLLFDNLHLLVLRVIEYRILGLHRDRLEW